MSPGQFRLFLAFVVVIHHSFPLRLGAWAVGMFFVLSGFWISRMWRTGYSRKSRPYLTFLISRWWRIAPLFITVHLMAASLVWSGLTIGNPAATHDWRWWVTQPWVIGSTQFDRLLPPSWSLDVEMQFYLVAPLIVAAILYGSRHSPSAVWRRNRENGDGTRRVPATEKVETGMPERTRLLVEDASIDLRELGNGTRRVPATLLGVALVAWSAWRLTHGASLETPRLDVFAWLFFVGVACEIADWRPSLWMAIASGAALIGIVAILYSMPDTRSLVWVRGADTHAQVSTIWMAVSFIVMTLVSVPLAIRTVHQPSPSSDRWMGDLSFPLYLFHWMPRDWYYANVDWSLGALRNGGLLMANFAFAFAGAIVLLQLVDRPIQRYRQRWVRRISNNSKHQQQSVPRTNASEQQLTANS